MLKDKKPLVFCYINDCVLAILELQKVYQRVVYIDIDVHHGDGVEEAFFTSDRVMTVSIHKFKDFFPGTGNFNDVGYLNGLWRSVNAPQNEGIDDHCYISLFKPIIDAVMTYFRPEAVVQQCGTDSQSGDKQGFLI